MLAKPRSRADNRFHRSSEVNRRDRERVCKRTVLGVAPSRKIGESKPMGVEYTHYLMVDDLTYVGTHAIALTLQDVLTTWGLIAGPPTIRSLDGGKAKKLRQTSLAKVPVDFANLLVEFPHTEAETIADIMGPSEYDNVDSRYIQAIALLIGADYRVYDGGETAFTTVIHPPQRNGKEVKPYKPNFKIRCYTNAYPADGETTPPKAVLKPDLHDWPLPKGFCGIWRCGVILDCGKDLPAFAQKTNKLPSTRFASDITKAFGAKIVQVGHFY